MHDNFEKKYSGKMCWILHQQNKWLTGYFRISRLCYCQRFETVYKTSTNIAEAYYFSSNRASHITTLKVKVLSPNSWYKHVSIWLTCCWKLFTGQKQVICVVIRKQVTLNQLKDLLALNIYVQNFQCPRL